MEIRKATVADCYAIAELALIAGEGIPAYFWRESNEKDQDIVRTGAGNATSETDNFSYRNVHLAVVDGEVAGMLLAYRLPDETTAGNSDDLPAFILPLIELEQCVPGSFYINMLAAYPQFRNLGVGTALMAIVDQLALQQGCALLSVEVFEQNKGALRLYQRLGYHIREHRRVVPHPCHPYTGNILLLTKEVIAGDGTGPEQLDQCH